MESLDAHYRALHADPERMIRLAEPIFERFSNLRSPGAGDVLIRDPHKVIATAQFIDPRFSDEEGMPGLFDRQTVQRRDDRSLDGDMPLIMGLAEAMGLTVPEYPFDFVNDDIDANCYIITGGRAEEMMRRLIWTWENKPDGYRDLITVVGGDRPLTLDEYEYALGLDTGEDRELKYVKPENAKEHHLATAITEHFNYNYMGVTPVASLFLLATRPDNLDAIRQVVYQKRGFHRYNAVTTQLYVPFTKADALTVQVETGNRFEVGAFAGPSTQEKIDARTPRTWLSENMKTVVSNARHHIEIQRRT